MQRKEEGGVEMREGVAWEQKIGRQDRRETSHIETKRNSRLALKDKKKF
jgi:hypothetical protein